MKIDQQPVPALVLEAWKQAVAQATPAAIQKLLSQHKELGDGYRVGKVDLKVARSRIQHRLGVLQELPPAYRELLQHSTLSASLLALLSEPAIERWATPLCHYFGTVALVAALYLDERETLRQWAVQWLAQPPGQAPLHAPAPDTDAFQTAAQGLQTACAPLWSHLQTVSRQAATTATPTAEALTQTAPHSPLPQRSANEQRLMQAWRSQDKEAKRLRRELNALINQHQQQAQTLAATQHALEAAKALASQAEAERTALQTQWHTRVAEQVRMLLDERLLPWLRPAETLATEVANLSSLNHDLLQQAEALLQRQAAQDRLHGLRSQLRAELQACQQAYARLQQACQEALRPLPALPILADKLQARIQQIEQRLQNHAPAVVAAHPLLAQIEQSLAAQPTLEGITGVRRAVQASAALGWLQGPALEQAHALLHHASSRLYALAAASGHQRSLAGPALRALQAELAQGRTAALVVDGHNVLYTQTADFKPWYEQGQPGARARERLVQQLLILAQRHPNLMVDLWFDGPILADSNRATNVRVHYSGGQGSDRADIQIVAHLRHLQAQPQPTLRVLVTQDHAEAMQAEEAGALLLAPAELLWWLRPRPTDMA